MKLFAKRAISVALAVCMAVGSIVALNAEKIGGLADLFAVKADAAETVSSGSCGDNVTYTLDSDGLLTISGTGAMTDYSWDNATPWKDAAVKSVVISDGVTSIGEDTFSDCTELTSITIGNSVTSIGEWAFFRCTGLTSMTIGNSVTSIDDYAFGFTGLTSITIPDSVTSIGEGAFCGCTGLTSITIPDSVTEIEYKAFSGCTGLTSVTIPVSVTSIGVSAFEDVANIVYNGTVEGAPWGARALNGHIEGKLVYNDSTKTKLLACFSSKQDEVVIPNSVTSIGEDAFFGCTGLTSVTIPNSVTSIGKRAFVNVANIVYSGTASGSPWGARALNGYVEDDFVYKDSTKTTLLACSSSKQGEVVIPNSVTSIGEFAFNGCTGLTSVTIPDSVTSIGVGAFDGCSGLTSVTIPDSVTSIGDGAFYSCSGLTSVTIPDSVTSIGEFAFYGCSGLTSVTIPDSVTSIGEYAFDSCSGLTSVTIPDSVTSIGGTAFYGCKETLTIFGKEGSYAQTYAEQNGINFKKAEPTTEPTTEPKTDPATVPTAKPTIESVAEKVETVKVVKTETGAGVLAAVGGTDAAAIRSAAQGAKIVDKDGKEVSDDAPLATGMKIVLGGETVEIAVLGDIDGDAKISVADARLALRQAVSLENLQGVYLLAGKVGSDTLSVSEARTILRAAVGLEDSKDWLK